MFLTCHGAVFQVLVMVASPEVDSDDFPVPDFRPVELGPVADVLLVGSRDFALYFGTFHSKSLIHGRKQRPKTAEFAATERKLWPMHDLLFENQNRFAGAL